jgi:hypothetical protein
LDQGKVYLDVSVVVDSLDQALRLGRLHSQVAVFDLGAGVAIDCGVGVAA